MSYNQGDIVLVPFPLTDLSQSKVRPAIIVSGVDINNSQDVILAAITTNLRDDEFSFLLENSDLTKSIDKPSEVRCHKLFTCDQSIIKKAISRLNKTALTELIKQIKRGFSTL